jgi:hypothetical protein
VTEPTVPSRWTAFRDWLAGRFGRRDGGSRVNPAVVVSVIVAAALLAGLALWINALTVPVHREGRPTTSVSPLPERTTLTPTPTPTPSGTSTATSEPTEMGPAPTPVGQTMKSSGKFDTAGVSVAAAGSSGTLRRYTVRVETSSGLKADKVGRQIAGVLNDPRSWAGSGNVRFALVADPDRADFTVTLASPRMAMKSCKPEPSSCTSGADVVIDAAVWRGEVAEDFASTSAWQAYLVNHAVGHLLGGRHEDCQKKGKPAPVMMPQESGLRGCTANPWPFP